MLSAVAALLHVGCIILGAPWYRFVGAGERFVKLSAAGSLIPTLATCAIAVVLATWSPYALSAAGVILRLPLLRLAMCSITLVFMARGVAGFWFAVFVPAGRSVAFWCWSSAVCIGIGALYLVGTHQVWPQLSQAAA